MLLLVSESLGFLWRLILSKIWRSPVSGFMEGLFVVSEENILSIVPRLFWVFV